MNKLACFTALLISLSYSSNTGAQTSPAENPVEQVQMNPPAILPLRDRAELQDRWLADRLDNVLPALMREQNIDLWVLIAREYFEDPVVATMLDAESMHAKRRTILLFHDPGEGRPVERLTVSRYGIGNLFKSAWDPKKVPDQWKQLAELITERRPKRLAINSSALTQFGDGMTLSQYEALAAALPPAIRQRILRNDALAVTWLETRTKQELEVYPSIVQLAHSIISEGLSSTVVVPGETSADDVVWWMRERVKRLGLDVWFQPTVGIIRQGRNGTLEGDAIIQQGDMLWTDFGITYLGLNTDTQHLAYVLKDGEQDAPEGLKAGLAAANAVADALTSSFKVGRTGNQILTEARSKAIAKGLKPSIYSHPIGYHGHGAGSSIGFWDNQKPHPSGEHPLRKNTAWSIELSAKLLVPEWNNQEVEFGLEENAYFDGEKVVYLDGHQDRLHLIAARLRH